MTNRYTGHIHPAIFVIMATFWLAMVYGIILGIKSDYGTWPKKLLTLWPTWLAVMTWDIVWYGWLRKYK